MKPRAAPRVGSDLGSREWRPNWKRRSKKRPLAFPQNPHKSVILAASPQKTHGRNGTPRHIEVFSATFS